jgi:thioredoxin-like negative regulator of GroEL
MVCVLSKGMSDVLSQLIAAAKESAADQRFDDCAQSFAAALKESPDDPQVLRELASVMIDLGQVDEGLALLSDSVSLEAPDGPTLYRIATLLKGQNRHDEAADILLCMLAYDPENLGLFEETSSLLKQLGREKELFPDETEDPAEGE